MSGIVEKRIKVPFYTISIMFDKYEMVEESDLDLF